MRILIIARSKQAFNGKVMPFVSEQGEALQKAGCEVEYLPLSHNYWDVRPIARKIHEYHPDIVHAHYGLSGITAMLQTEVPVVVTFHNGEILNKAINFLTSLFSLKASHVIYVAEHIRRKCYFKRKKNYSIIPCGVNLEDCKIIDNKTARQQLGFESCKKYVLFGGAFENLRKNYPLLKRAIELTGRKDIFCIEMKGLKRQQITQLMCACDLFALPSYSEGSPQALKEAMACNCPIIATDIADVRYLLGDVCGHFICSFEEQNVADNLIKALSFNGRTKGRERILKLGLTNEQVASKLLEIYKSITKTHN